MKKIFSNCVFSFVCLCAYVCLFTVLLHQTFHVIHKIVVCLFIVLLITILYVLKKKQFLNIFLSSFMILLSCGFIATTGYLQGINRVIDVAKKDVLQNVLVYTHQSSQLEIAQLKDKNIGVILQGNDDSATYFLTNKEINSNIVIYYDFNKMFQDFYNDEISAIMIMEKYQNTVRSNYTQFSDKMKLLKSYAVNHQTKKDFKNRPVSVYFNITNKVGNQTLDSSHMILSVNPVSKQILITSIPSSVLIKNSCRNLQRETLKHINEDGVYCSWLAINKLLEHDIDYYIQGTPETMLKMYDLVITSKSDQKNFSKQEFLDMYLNILRHDELFNVVSEKFKAEKFLKNLEKVSYIVGDTMKFNFTADKLHYFITEYLISTSNWHVTHQILEGNLISEQRLEIYQSSLENIQDQIRNIQK